MPSSDAEDLRRQFDALIAGADLADLRQMASHMALLAGGDPIERASNPNLRHPRREEHVILRVRVDLNRAHPPIWRRLDLRSDLTLDAVHQILQTTYGWTDSHLHRFSIGGEPFDVAAEWFLCDYDAEEGEDDGTPDVEVHLEETLHEPGDVVHYIYDYGDHWDVTIRLEEVLPLTEDAPLAGCVDGERAGPPDDCGSLRDAEDLADVLDDPAAFDPHELNEQLASPAYGLIAWGVRRDLVALLNRLRHTPMGDDLLARTLALGNVDALSPKMVEANLAGHQWFLDRAVEGIALTTAGYLKPVDVEEACAGFPRSATGSARRTVRT